MIHAACEQRPLYDKLPHDSVRDISPVSLFVTVPSVVVVSPEVLSVRDAQEFVRSLKANPGKVNCPAEDRGQHRRRLTIPSLDVANPKQLPR